MQSQPPTLETPRLRLRPITSEDVDALFDLFGDPTVTRYWGFGTLRNRSAAAALIVDILADCRAGRIREWAVTLRSRDEADPADAPLIGTSALCSLHPVHRRADLGFAISPSHQRQGYATEAARAVLDHGFRDLRLHRVTADADPRNAPSLRVLRKLGFREEGHLREHYRQNDEWQDGVLFGLLATEWTAAQRLES